MARAAKASTAPKGNAAPATASKSKAAEPAKVVKSKASPTAPAPAKAAPAKASKAVTAKATTPPPSPLKSSKAKAPAAPPAPAKQPAVTMKHLAADLSDRHGLSRRDAESFADALVSDLVERMRSGARVRIAGLGILEIKDKPARMARNPATGASVHVAASRKVTFRVAKALKESI